MRVGTNFRRGTGGDQLAPEATGTRPQIDHIVCALNSVGVVLHNQDGIAQIPQLDQCIEETVVIPGMKADRGFIKNVEYAAELRSNLCCQTNSLGFSARQRGSRAVETQVVQANRQQKLQASANLINHAARDLRLPFPELPGAHRQERPGDGHGGELGDGNTVNADCQTGGPKPFSLTRPALDG